MFDRVDLRRHGRALETALDSKLTAYSKLASSISRAGGRRDELVMEEEGEGGYKLVEEEVEELIAKVNSHPTSQRRADVHTVAACPPPLIKLSN